MIQGIPEFYKEVLSAWGSFLARVDFKPVGREITLNQPIFLNKKIGTQGKELYFKKWVDVGILKVRDILYEFKEGFLPVQVIIDAMEEAKEEDNVLRKQYEEVKSKIPEDWLEMIQGGGSGENKMEVFLKLNDKEVCFKSCKAKTF